VISRPGAGGPSPDLERRLEPGMELDPDLARARQPEVVHGYLPPAQPPGSIVIAYCGEPMIVRGEFTAEPPLDTCAECVAIWEHERRAAERRAAGRPPGV
jgi:hypothetical protein